MNIDKNENICRELKFVGNTIGSSIINV